MRLREVLRLFHNFNQIMRNATCLPDTYFNAESLLSISSLSEIEISHITYKRFSSAAKNVQDQVIPQRQFQVDDCLDMGI